MLRKLFKRTKTVPVAPEPMAPAPVAVEPKKSNLDAFRDEWETAQEVVEGDGGHTDWATWTEAVESEKKAFAPTEPMPLEPK